MTGKSSRNEERAPKVKAEPVAQELHDSLLALRSKVAVQVRTLSANSLAMERHAGEDLADVGSDSFIRDTELSLMTEDDNKLRLIDAAIKRMEDGTYGICAECGEAIPPRRLKAIPYAMLCVDCQSAVEAFDR